MREYSQFIDTVRAYADGEDPVKRAIEDCISRGILAEYLKRKGSEVRNMLVAEYSYEEDIKVKQEEARQEGISQGMERMIINALTTTGSIKQTASILRLAEETVRRIAGTNGIVEEEL